MLINTGWFTRIPTAAEPWPAAADVAPAPALAVSVPEEPALPPLPPDGEDAPLGTEEPLGETDDAAGLDVPVGPEVDLGPPAGGLGLGHGFV